MKPLDPEILHQYADGELAADEAQRVEEALERDESARQELARLKELRELVRDHLKGEVEAHPPRPMWERISDAIEEPAPAAASEGKVSGVRELGRATRWWPIWAGAAAAAVLVAFVVWMILADRGEPAGPSKEPAAEPSNGLVVESVEYEGRPPTFFQIPDRDGESTTTVIWVSPQPGGSAEPEDDEASPRDSI
jgi:anti-sigma factor RsiW